MDGSSSSSRCIEVLILSSSPRVFGSIAYDSTGSGNLMGGNVVWSDLSPIVSFVSVSLSFATDPRSPALSSGTVVCVLPWSSTRWPRRSGASLVLLCTVESALNVPDTTRNIVMRPANGSAIVFQTNADAGAFSSAARATSVARLVQPLERPVGGRGQVREHRVEELRDADVQRGRCADQRKNLRGRSSRFEGRRPALRRSASPPRRTSPSASRRLRRPSR